MSGIENLSVGNIIIMVSQNSQLLHISGACFALSLTLLST